MGLCRHVSLHANRSLIRRGIAAVCLVLLILPFHVSLQVALLRLLLLLEFLLEHAAPRAHLSFSFLAVSLRLFLVWKKQIKLIQYFEFI